MRAHTDITAAYTKFIAGLILYHKKLYISTWKYGEFRDEKSKSVKL